MIGTGYVGLVTGACFAEMGHTVMCLDINSSKIAGLQQGIIPIFEPGLEDLVKRNAAQKRLFFTTDYEKGVEFAEVCFIAVPTPSREDGSCDTGYVESAARSIGKVMTAPKIVVNKSTVPVGTAAFVSQCITEELKLRGRHIAFDVVSNPEFLKEGAACLDCLKPDRIIIGADNPTTLEVMKELYSAFNVCRDRVITMDILGGNDKVCGQCYACDSHFVHE